MNAPTVTLVGDNTYAGLVFEPGVKGVEGVEVTLPYSEQAEEDTGGERCWTLEDHDAAEAYARILVAAPELLAALVGIAEELEQIAGLTLEDGDTDTLFVLAMQARKAIAKAMGSEVSA